MIALTLTNFFPRASGRAHLSTAVDSAGGVLRKLFELDPRPAAVPTGLTCCARLSVFSTRAYSKEVNNINI